MEAQAQLALNADAAIAQFRIVEDAAVLDKAGRFVCAGRAIYLFWTLRGDIGDQIPAVWMNWILPLR